VCPTEERCDNGMLDVGVHPDTYEEKVSEMASGIDDCGRMKSLGGWWSIGFA
jgi:hypothetical protein